jgi:heat shock protein 4
MSTNPRNTVSQLKRLMGKKFSDPHVQEDLQNFPFTVVAGPSGECLIEVRVRFCKLSKTFSHANTHQL